MKKYILSLLIAICWSFSSQAQENKTIKKVTTTKRVVTKVGSKVIVKETKTVEGSKGAVVVANDEKENQYFAEDSTKINDKKVLVDKVDVDAENEARIAAIKMKQAEELEKSKAEAAAKAAAEKKILDAKKAELDAQLEANRKRLMKRGKGTGKLNKKRKRNN